MQIVVKTFSRQKLIFQSFPFSPENSLHAERNVTLKVSFDFEMLLDEQLESTVSKTKISVKLSTRKWSTHSIFSEFQWFSLSKFKARKIYWRTSRHDAIVVISAPQNDSFTERFSRAAVNWEVIRSGDGFEKARKNEPFLVPATMRFIKMTIRIIQVAKAFQVTGGEAKSWRPEIKVVIRFWCEKGDKKFE